MITQDQLKEVLHYCPETGVFTWLQGRHKGAEAGSIRIHTRTGKSYRTVGVFGLSYQAHRLSFLYITGAFPEDQVDHIDGNGCNNVWRNLRAVTRAENAMNRRKPVNNTSGTTGVCWFKPYEKWHARIVLDGCTKHLGYFHSKEDAITARKTAEVLCGYHENHGTERPL